MRTEIKYTDNYIHDLFIKCGLDENIYPYTLSGLLMFLSKNHIYVKVIDTDKNRYYYSVLDYNFLTGDMELVSEDLNDYETFYEALEYGIIEGICYLSNKLKIK